MQKSLQDYIQGLFEGNGADRPRAGTKARGSGERRARPAAGARAPNLRAACTPAPRARTPAAEEPRPARDDVSPLSGRLEAELFDSGYLSQQSGDDGAPRDGGSPAPRGCPGAAAPGSPGHCGRQLTQAQGAALQQLIGCFVADGPAGEEAQDRVVGALAELFERQNAEQARLRLELERARRQAERYRRAYGRMKAALVGYVTGEQVDASDGDGHPTR